jgi:hypothetical protein
VGPGDTCLHKKGRAKAVQKVGRGLCIRSVGHMAWPAGCHLVSYHLGQVQGAPPQPYKTTPTGGN